MDIQIYSTILRRLIVSELSRRQGEPITPELIIELSDEIIKSIADYAFYSSPPAQETV